jgi:hypothetical protein
MLLGWLSDVKYSSLDTYWKITKVGVKIGRYSWLQKNGK